MSVLSKVSPLFVVIHSNEEERNSYLIPKVHSLAAEMGTTVELIGEGYHKKFTIIDALKYSFATYKVSRKSFQNMPEGIDFTTKIKKNIRSVRHAISSLDITLETRGKLYNLISKHFLAWKLFYESENKLLIVFENDIRFKDTSNYDLKKLLSVIESNEDDKFVFCDIAGGFDSTKILRSEILYKKDNFSINLSQPGEDESQTRFLIKLPRFVTNTTCGYILNKKVAKLAIDYFAKTAILSPDWFFNELLFDIESLSTEILCYSSLPPLFEHGSAVGSYKSVLNSDF